MDSFFECGFRTNVSTYSYRNKNIFVYNSHRTILNIIFCALKHKFISSVPNVVSFDYHDDGCTPSQDVLDKASSFHIDKISEKDFNSIVEFELRHLNDDWVKAGMAFNIINHAIFIGTEVRSNGSEHYKDINSVEHDIVCMSHLSSSLSSRGVLGDSIIKSDDYQRPREILNYNHEKPDSFGKITMPFVLDFDLDCFSEEFRTIRMSWTESIFLDELNSRCGYHDQITPLQFIHELINRCEFITIAMEQECCGGFGESFKILSLFDKYIFEGVLNTNTSM